MSIPTSEPILPDDEEPTPAPRARRPRRIELDAEAQSDRLSTLIAQTTPAFDFFLFLLVSSAILVAALLFDSAALFLLAALFMPFLSPVVGISVGAAGGDGRHLGKSFALTLAGALIVFAAGLLAGFLTSFMTPPAYEQAAAFARFSWPLVVVLVIGAGLVGIILGRSPRVKPLIPSVALGYALYIPLAVAGYGLTSGFPGLWPDGLIVFVVHLVFAQLVAALAFLVSGVRPGSAFGYAATAAFAVLSGLALFLLGGFGRNTSAPVISAGLESTPTATITPSMTPSPSAPVVVTTDTPTPTITLAPTNTPTLTVTPEPTPIWAKVWAPEGNGALIRQSPKSDAAVLSSILNESPVQVLGEPVQGPGGPWVRILTESGLEGWIVQNLLVTATPSPDW